MRVVGDFHIHSKYSRATSPKMDLDNLNNWTKIKGINLLGTGDFTHPAWFSELKNKLAPIGNGLFEYKNDKKISNLPAGVINQKINYILTAEISSIYSQGGKVRKIHNIIFAPSFEVVDKINKRLSTIGNLYSDGRPILGLSAYDLAKIVFEISEDCMVIPAHAWTPWFSIFGSNSGFDTIEECFKDLTPQIFSIETGLSSDPPMNWRLKALDKITLISNSDAHSLPKIGREANIFEIDEKDLSYNEIRRVLKEKDRKNFLYTVEFFPEEGKYHWDGHRSHNFRVDPTKEKLEMCPVDKKPLTIGVLHRVEDLADKPVGTVPKNSIGYKSLVPLQEIIAEAKGQNVLSVNVQNEYMSMISNFGSEFRILLDLEKEDLLNADSRIVEGIMRVREGKIKIKPGYDGVFGTVSIFGNKEINIDPKIFKKEKSQMKLF